MKRILPILAALILTACNNNAKTVTPATDATDTLSQNAADSQELAKDDASTTSPDILAFGLKGPVKEVITLTYGTEEQPDGTLIAGEVLQKDTISFNASGLVTVDPFGAIYEYDKDGKFVKGVTEKSVMKRDEKGRVIYYNQQNDDEDDAMFTIEFTYDAQGRISKVNTSFWEGTQTKTFIYEADNIYPVKMLFESSDEGTNVESEGAYRYTKFDKYGNWTEREHTYSGTETEEGEDDYSSRWSGKNIERRTIEYYK